MEKPNAINRWYTYSGKQDIAIRLTFKKVVKQSGSLQFNPISITR